MSTLESNKTMAMIGSILLIIGGIPLVPYIGILSLIGVILLLMAIKGFSQSYQEPSMYDNALKGFIYYIIAVIMLAVAVALLWASVFSIASIVLIGLGVIGIVGFIVTLIIAFIFYVMAAKRLRTTLNSLAQKTGEKSFETAGTLLYYGAILTIVLVGGILIFIAWIFATLGFFQMKTSGQPQNQQQYGYAPPPPPPPTQAAGRYCPNCGSPVDASATFCPHCGKQISA
ncbi:MAG: DUF996 domain-containing protein [Candidatus Bathyarchaeia archaeon]